MKNYIIIALFLISIFKIYSQENIELKKIKCLKKMPITYEDIEKLDTIFILYHKSDLKDFEQNKIDIKNYHENSYYFYNYLHFPMDIYDSNDGFDKINLRKPIVMYKTGSFICKNIKRVIDIYFLNRIGQKFYNHFYEKKRITFIIDLDAKIKNKYKIVQVNNSKYIID